MQTSEVLNAAADHIERGGWWNGCDDPEAGGTCAHLSISDVTGDDLRTRINAQNALIAYIDAVKLSGIWAWNDAPERTAAEVIEALRACAVIEQSRERQPVEAVA